MKRAGGRHVPRWRPRADRQVAGACRRRRQGDEGNRGPRLLRARPRERGEGRAHDAVRALVLNVQEAQAALRPGIP